MRHLIRQCILNFGPAPREFSLWDRLTMLHLPKPLWLRKNSRDELWMLFDRASEIYCEGRVVWGHLVQANSLLFQPGKDNCPAAVIFSLCDQDQLDPEILAQAAKKLFALKGTQPADPRLRAFADSITNEMTRPYGLEVPLVVSPRARCRMSTIFFARKHLPGGFISCPLLPIVVSATEPYVTLPLPPRYWPDELLAMWTG